MNQVTLSHRAGAAGWVMQGLVLQSEPPARLQRSTGRHLCFSDSSLVPQVAKPVPLGRTGKGKSTQEADVAQYNCAALTALNSQPKVGKKQAGTKDKVRRTPRPQPSVLMCPGQHSDTCPWGLYICLTQTCFEILRC